MRKAFSPLFVAAVLSLGACGGGGSSATEDTITAEAVAQMSVPDMLDRLVDDADRMVVVLQDIDSEAAAEAAAPQLEAMAKNYQVMGERLETLGDELSFGDMTALARRMPTLATKLQSVATEIQRIQADHPEAADILGRTLEGVDLSSPQ